MWEKLDPCWVEKVASRGVSGSANGSSLESTLGRMFSQRLVLRQIRKDKNKESDLIEFLAPDFSVIYFLLGGKTGSVIGLV